MLTMEFFGLLYHIQTVILEAREGEGWGGWGLSQLAITLCRSFFPALLLAFTKSFALLLFFF